MTSSATGVSIGSRTISKPLLVGATVGVLAVAGAGVGIAVSGGGGSSKPTAAVAPQPSTSSSGGTDETSAKPILTPIHAVFTQSAFSTVYTENATGSGLAYAWAVHIPADPNCAQGFKPDSPKPDEATWYHADTSQGGPCNHSGLLSDL